MAEEQNYYVEYRPSIKERITRWFGYRYRDPGFLPDDQERNWAPGFISANTSVRLGFGDRLRVLASGRMLVSSRIHTDVPVKTALTLSAASVIWKEPQ